MLAWPCCCSSSNSASASSAFEKRSIERADRSFSNRHLLREQIVVYGAIRRLFCTSKHPAISSDLDKCKRHFLPHAVLSFEGRTITLYQEKHPLSTKKELAVHKVSLRRLSQLLPLDCKPAIVIDADFKTLLFT